MLNKDEERNIKHAHPNCPKCTRGLKYYHKLGWSVYANMEYNYQKLHRLYGRERNKFVAIGWYCKKCGFTIIEKFISGTYCIQFLAGNGKNDDKMRIGKKFPSDCINCDIGWYIQENFYDDDLNDALCVFCKREKKEE